MSVVLIQAKPVWVRDVGARLAFAPVRLRGWTGVAGSEYEAISRGHGSCGLGSRLRSRLQTIFGRVVGRHLDGVGLGPR
jgi:hypothetical protein